MLTLIFNFSLSLVLLLYLVLVSLLAFCVSFCLFCFFFLCLLLQSCELSPLCVPLNSQPGDARVLADDGGRTVSLQQLCTLRCHHCQNKQMTTVPCSSIE
jgi:hypothetical protein